MAFVTVRSALFGLRRPAQVTWRPQPCCQLSQTATVRRRAAWRKQIPPVDPDFPWRIMVSLCITRPPQLARVMDDTAIRFFEQRTQELEEKAVSSEYEKQMNYLQRLKDAIDKQAKGLPVKGFTLEELSSDVIEKHSERLQVEQTVSEQFTPANRLTEDDLNSVLTSTNRCLDKNLHLVVRKDREMYDWQLPQALWPGVVSLRTTAEEAVRSIFSEKLKVKFLSNAPSGHLSYKFHRDYVAEDKKRGAKVFIYKAYLESGTVDLESSSTYSEFRWLTRDQLCTVFGKKELNRFLRFTLP